MKTVALLSIALLLAASIHATDKKTELKVKKVTVEEGKVSVEGVDRAERLSVFSVSTNWTAMHLVYGPVEILAGAATPVLGLFVGAAAGVAVPPFFMRKGCELLIPITVICGMGAGATAGTAITPLCLLEGTFDTLTGGAFSNGLFSWIDTGDLLSGKTVIMETIETEIIEAADEPADKPADKEK